VSGQIQLAEGELLESVTLGPSRQASAFRVAGKVAGIDELEVGEAERAPPLIIRLHPLGRSSGISTRGDQHGRFEFQSVPEGRYRMSAVVGGRTTGESRPAYHLGVIDVARDRIDIVVRPEETGSVEGRVILTSGRMPASIYVNLASKEGLGDHVAQARAEDPSFQVSGLVPGEYRVRVQSSELYVKEVLQSRRAVPISAVAITPGENRLEIVLAGDHGRVFGTIRDPATGSPLPLGSIALMGPGGLRTQQVDQTGQFLFDKVIPGDYRVCAWSDIVADAMQDINAWQAAGCEDKIIPVDPESDVEISLTAASK
jgi:hypothetical protein